MEFVRILEDARLWAVKYDGEKDNCFDALFSQWFDISGLKSFFQNNLSDLSSFFRITDVYQAVMETIDEASRLECLMLDVSPDADLDLLFRHLENSRYAEIFLGKEKAKGYGIGNHSLAELAKLEHVRNYLIDNGVFDVDSLIDYNDEQSN